MAREELEFTVGSAPQFRFGENTPTEHVLALTHLERLIQNDPGRMLQICLGEPIFEPVALQTDTEAEPAEPSIVDTSEEQGLFSLATSRQLSTDLEFDPESERAIDEHPEFIATARAARPRTGLSSWLDTGGQTEVTGEDIRRKRLEIFIRRMLAWQSRPGANAPIISIHEAHGQEQGNTPETTGTESSAAS